MRKSAREWQGIKQSAAMVGKVLKGEEQKVVRQKEKEKKKQFEEREEIE